MIKVTIGQLANDSENLVKLSQVKLPVKVSYWINRTIKKILPDIEAFEEKRIALVKELGEDKGAAGFEVTEKNLPEFRKKMNELKEVVVEINVEPIDIKSIENINIEPSLIMDWLFKSE